MGKDGVRTRIRLALPAMTQQPGMSAAAKGAAAVLEKTLLGDLEYSGVFDVQDQEILSVLELTGDRAQDFPMYRSLGNQMILLGELAEESGRLIIEARVLDLENFGAICQGKRYRGTFEQARRVAHTYADEVVSCVTGSSGVSLTSIAFASNRTGHKEIFIMDYDGYEQRPLSGHQSISMAPAWSPPGDGLAYVSYFSGHPSIYWVELATGEKRPIVEDGLHNFTPDLLAGRPVGCLHPVARRQHRDLQGQPARRPAGTAHPQRPHRRQPGVEPERTRDRLHLGPGRLAADLRDGRRRRQRASGVEGGPQQRRGRAGTPKAPASPTPTATKGASASTSRSPTW